MSTGTIDVNPPAPGCGPAATVFFDGACPLCRKEIAHYRRLPGADRLSWIDISEAEAALQPYGLSRDAAMARLHVLDAAGNWQTGAWGFAELWSHLPAYSWLAAILRRTRILPLLDRGYAYFARRRLLRRCENGFCAKPGGTGVAGPTETVSTSKPSGAKRQPQNPGEKSCA
jgi:predicted DCC family thiol-disulfide oxidoreductase YuxK